MRKVYIYQSQEGKMPFVSFLNALDEKLRKKLDYTLKKIVITNSNLVEPNVKHFCIERYSELYELREKARVLARVVFVFTSSGDLILLYPFIKHQKRDTLQALEQSLAMLEDIKQRTDALVEYSFLPKGCGK